MLIGRRARPAGAVALAIVGLVGAGLVVLSLVRSPSPPTALPDRAAASGQPPGRTSAPESARVESRHGGVRDLIAGPVLPAAEPVTVSIPRIDVVSRLVRLGLDGTGAMEVPQDPATAGWYRRGPTPGALGPAVIAGHVTWDRVPAVFFRLAQLRRGDLVQVARSDDRVAVFRVTRVTRFAKSRFPTRAVFGGIDHAGLRLITCGGEFDRRSHRYRDNVVAFAALVTAHRDGRGS